MKITITREFDSVEEAVEFLQPHMTDVVVVERPMPLKASELPEQAGGTPPATTEKKPRKPRSDAGQPRGPYKTKEAESAAAPTADGQASAKPALTDNALASGETGSSAAAAPAPAAPERPVELTIDDLKAAMTVLSKKHGIEANMKLLAQFGTEKVSLLPKEKYAAFHAAVKNAAGVA
jgi:hypothetical protein